MHRVRTVALHTDRHAETKWNRRDSSLSAPIELYWLLCAQVMHKIAMKSRLRLDRDLLESFVFCDVTASLLRSHCIHTFWTCFSICCLTYQPERKSCSCDHRVIITFLLRYLGFALQAPLSDQFIHPFVCPSVIYCLKICLYFTHKVHFGKRVCSDIEQCF